MLAKEASLGLWHNVCLGHNFGKKVFEFIELIGGSGIVDFSIVSHLLNLL